MGELGRRPRQRCDMTKLDADIAFGIVGLLVIILGGSTWAYSRSRQHDAPVLPVCLETAVVNDSDGELVVQHWFGLCRNHRHEERPA